ncbi:MAG: hypothetical protein JWN50_442 [Parcubacteria group bacterium]|nr:hypothetical protein [Parcubacteria group bacterium]
MPKSRIILALGFFIALLPVLGFPHSWESFFEVASGLLIVFLSVLISVDRRLTLKSKAEKRHLRKRALVNVQMAEAMPADRQAESHVYGRRASDHVPEAVPHYGRRVSDKRINVRDGDTPSQDEPQEIDL